MRTDAAETGAGGVIGVNLVSVAVIMGGIGIVGIGVGNATPLAWTTIEAGAIAG